MIRYSPGLLARSVTGVGLTIMLSGQMLAYFFSPYNTVFYFTACFVFTSVIACLWLFKSMIGWGVNYVYKRPERYQHLGLVAVGITMIVLFAGLIYRPLFRQTDPTMSQICFIAGLYGGGAVMLLPKRRIARPPRNEFSDKESS